MINAVLFDLDDTLHDKKKGLELCAAFLHKSFLAEEVPKKIFVDEFVAQNCAVQTKTEAFSKLSENLGFNRNTCDSQQSPSADYQFLAYESFATILSNIEGRKGNERA